MAAEPAAGQLAHEVAGQDWYHTIELAPGVTTPGWFDTRPVAPRIPLPADLAGRRCLDVGTFDGFWAFEMERRGAAEVVAIDVPDPRDWDWPADASPDALRALAARQRGGAGFRLAHRALASRVTRRELSVHELDPRSIGEFDFVYVGSLLLHLRDPVGALARVREICTGSLVLVDNYDPLLTRLAPRRPLAQLEGVGRPWWWRANLAGVVRMLEAAGFEIEDGPLRLRMPAGRGQPVPRLRPRTLRDRELRRALRDARLGDPHVAVRARRRRA